MPIYEYKCPDCQNQFEQFYKTSGNSIPKCPKCGSANSEKLLSVPGMVRTKNHSDPGHHTCCGRSEKCATPPCSNGGDCCRN